MKLKITVFILVTFTSLFSYSNVVLKTRDTLRTVNKTSNFSRLDTKIAFKEVFSSNKDLERITPFFTGTDNVLPEYIKQFFGVEKRVIKDDFLDKLSKIFNEKTLKYVQNISKEELVQLPIGLKGQTNDGFKAEMVIVKAKVTPEYLELTAFARLETQFLNTHLYFAAEDLKLSHSGGIIGDWKLHSLGNTSLPQLGSKVLLTILGGDIDRKEGSIKGDSYIEFDCNGFKALSFKLDVRLSRSLVVPIDTEGKRKEYGSDLSKDKEKAIGNDHYVGATLGIKGGGWNDLLLQLDLPTFEITKLKNWSFKLKKATIDLSDVKNNPEVDKSFPKVYDTNGFFPEGNKNIWKGFFAEEVEITMPKQFSNKSTGERTKIQSTNLLIDNFGVSGTFAGYKLLEKGSASGWQYKLDYVGIGLELGRIKSAKVLGYIKPSATGDFIEILGTFNEDKYLFQASVTKYNFKMFKGKLIFEKNSWVKLEMDDSNAEFKASAFLNGKMAFKGGIEKNNTGPNDDSTIYTFGSSDSNVDQALGGVQTGSQVVVTKVHDYLNDNFSFIKADPKKKAVEQLKEYVDKGYDELRVFVQAQVFSYAAEIASEKNIEAKKENSQEEKDKEFYNFQGIVFQNLKLQSHALPYIEADYFGYPASAEQKFGNFSVAISNIRLVTPSKEELGLAFNMKVNLMGGGSQSDTNGFISAEAGLKILSKFENKTFHSYKFNGVAIDEIKIDVEKSGFTLKGGLKVFNEDPIYGKGFQGELAVELKKLEVKGMAKGIFAKKDFAHWFVDFQIENTGSSGKFGLQRVEGGLSYRMKRVDGNMMGSIGTNVYKPDAKSGLGFRAGVKAKFGESTSFKAKVFLEMEYNHTGGLNRIYFLGEGAMMSGNGQTEGNLRDTWASYDKIFSGNEASEMNNYLANGNMLAISKRTHPVSEIAKDGKVGVFVSIEKDFVHDSFDGLFELYLNLEGIKGSGENHKFGMVHMYSSPTKNYLHVGTPMDKLGAIFKIGSYDVNVGAYFMTGDVLPSQTPPHPRVLEILGPDIMNDNRNLSLLNDGKGFAFGLNFSVAISYDEDWFYAFLEAGGGFDITHRKLNGVSCAGRPGLVGNDGWYSMGQVYAYIYGEAGLRIKIFGIRKDIKILGVGIAAMLRGEFPNPTHMEGYVGVYYNVLGGMIKGRFKYKAEIGEKCEFIGMSQPLSIPLIASASPDGETNVDVFKKPQVAFNYSMLEPFSAEDMNGNRKLVRINLKKYVLKVDGTPLLGDIQWMDHNTKVNFVSSEVLPPQKEIVAEVEVGVEEKIGSSWIALQGGNTDTEKKTFTFKTGNAPEYIPLENISYSYPVVAANNFYPEEHKTVYIKLKQGQKYLFDGSVENWVLKGEVKEGTQLKVQAALNYEASAKKVSFTYDKLATQKNYQLQLTAYPVGTVISTGTSVDSTQNSGTTTMVTDASFTNEQIITQNTALAQNNTNLTKSFLNYEFKTSKHATFTEKIKSIKTEDNFFIPVSADVHKIQLATNKYENFNEAELFGNQYTNGKALISVEAVLEDSYYKEIISPLIYQNYPLEKGKITIKNRNIFELGLPPVRDISIIEYYRNEMSNNSNSIFINQRFPYEYSLVKTYKQDFLNIRDQVINSYLSTPINWEKYNQYKDLINGVFPILMKGEYLIKLIYQNSPEKEFSREVIIKYKRIN
ncbi:hypothetical protein BU993_02355 [Flavobacterium columnare]|uniref:hypothetical protein n=1 Tax=Flavobacterium columnare TaxID=996 RepID=UPI0007FB1CEF|nr:hypothetical protein [Flavobacterium columnare]APT21580.1 hypothetical protein BU993_02355 [Flavobacterium columnare]